jgi:large subunit ribosomal protein L4
MSINTFTSSGSKATTSAKLDKSIFGVVPDNHELLKAAYDMYLANSRMNLAVTKTRGEVSGGGKKPWKQKGTGRARFGSSRVPIWRGGGITFGPTGQENYSKQMNTKAKRLATRQALSLSAEASKISVIDEVKLESGKTSDLVKLLDKISAVRNILIVVDHKTDEMSRASSNLKTTKIVAAKYINVFDVLNADSIIISKKALDEIVAWLTVPTKTAGSSTVIKETK